MADDSRATRFPWPLGLVAVGLLAVLVVSTRQLLSPLVLAGLLAYLLFPFRAQPWVMRTLVLVGLITLRWFLSAFGWLLFVLGTSVFLAYVLDPAVSWLERRGWRRSLASLTLLVPAVALFGLILFVFIPPLFNEGKDILAALPEIPARFEAEVRPWLRDRGLDPGTFTSSEQVPALLERARALLSRVLARIISLTVAAGSFFSGLALVPFCTFYILLDARRAAARGARLVPPKYHSWFRDLAREMDRLLGRWLRGVGLVAVIIGAATYAGLLILGVPYAVLLAFLAALMNVIPVLGFWVSFIVASLVGIADMGMMGLVKVAALYFTLSVVESQILQPRLVGGAVGLHPVITLLALIVFTSLFGIVGAFLAVPLALFTGILTRQLIALYHPPDAPPAETSP